MQHARIEQRRLVVRHDVLRQAGEDPNGHRPDRQGEGQGEASKTGRVEPGAEPGDLAWEPSTDPGEEGQVGRLICEATEPGGALAEKPKHPGQDQPDHDQHEEQRHCCIGHEGTASTRLRS